MKTHRLICSLLTVAATSSFAAEPQPPTCTLIKPEKLIVYEDGSRELATTSVKHHGLWALSEGVIKGTHGNEAHLATLKFDQPFENCVLTFRLRFVDPGRFIFVGGGHGMDVAFGSTASDPTAPKPAAFVLSSINILERIQRDAKGKPMPHTRKSVGSAEKAFPVGEWIDVLIEHANGQVRVKIGDTEIQAKGDFDLGPKGKDVFYLNAGEKPGSRVEFDDIACWSGTPLEK
jgi:hypothetical protein